MNVKALGVKAHNELLLSCKPKRAYLVENRLQSSNWKMAF